MFTTYRRRWQLSRVKPGDGARLPEYRLRHVFTRSLFRVDLADPDGRGHVYEVDVRPGADGSTRHSPVSLYRDGVRVVARAGLSTGGTIALGLVAALAATERALTFRSRWMVDRRSLSARHPGTR